MRLFAGSGRLVRCRPWACNRTLLVTLCGALVSCLFFGQRVEAGTVPQYDTVKHLGVASCSSSQCHGAAKPYKEGNIRRTEYRTWSKEDKHSKAYEVLSNEQSRAMAKKLGLSNAQEAKICLDCHTDNVPKERRGDKFQIADGIGCEACHGGGERWIKSHTEDHVTHAKNIEQGMYQTEIPQERAKLCLSCHYGDTNKFATHRIMAAGHPRLSFELDTFTIRQEHYDIDKDYRERKGFVESVNTWAMGVATAAAESVAMLRHTKLSSDGLFPEIALFDCHACHHSMKDRRWTARATTPGLSPGAVRLNDSSLVMLYAITKTVSREDADRLLMAVRRVHEATAQARDAVAERAGELAAVIQDLQNTIQRSRVDRQAAAIRATLIELGTRGEFRDYSNAEQTVMGLAVLAYALGGETQIHKDTDKLYTLLADDSRYQPSEFAKAIGQLRQMAEE